MLGCSVTIADELDWFVWLSRTTDERNSWDCKSGVEGGGGV